MNVEHEILFFTSSQMGLQKLSLKKWKNIWKLYQGCT